MRLLERTLLLVAVAAVIAVPAAPAHAQIFIGPRDLVVGNVASVDSPNTLLLDTGQRVVLIGVAWLGPARRAPSARAFSESATTFTRDLVAGKRVWLQFDAQKYDLDGNLLAYVYLMSDGTFVNAEIIRKGYGRAFGGYYRNARSFARLDRQASRSSAGLWARLSPPPRPAVRTRVTPASPPSQSVEVVELTTADLKVSKAIAAARGSASTKSGKSAGGPVWVPPPNGAQLFIGGGPTNVSRVTKAVRNKVSPGAGSAQP
jgi:hypothetical protein